MLRRHLWLAAALLLLVPAAAFGAIVKGPYLINPGETYITVCWVTDDPDAGTVTYHAGDEEPRTGTSTPSRFFVDGFVDEYHHHVALLDLAPDSVYEYDVESGADTSGPFTFVTAPSTTQPYAYAVYGDTRGGTAGAPNATHIAVVSAIAEHAPDFFVNTGDLVSDGGRPANWDAYFFEVAELAAIAPHVPVFGNHESGFDDESGIWGTENWARFFPLFDEGWSRQWYAFDYGNVHHLVINVEDVPSLLFEGSPQQAFLRDDLATATADPATNFVVVYLHEPAFTWKEGRSPNTISQLTLDPIFRAYGVDIVFTGHDHFYARAYFNDMEHVTTGGGGAPLYDFIDDPEDRGSYRAHAKLNHYTIVEVGEMELRVTAYGVPGGEIIDQFSVMADVPPVSDDDDDNDDTADDDDDDVTDDDTGDDDDSPNNGGDAGDDDDDDGGCGT